MLRTPFYDFHAQHGARFVDFAGWEMPILYRSIIDEHQHVRQGVGLFDVSHMGRIRITGRHARKFLERMLTRRISDMAEKTCRYSLVCNEQGGTLDDVLIYRFDESWLLVVNASNREKILSHFKAQQGDASVKFEDETQSTGMVAVQGPRTMDLVGRFSREIPTLKRYAFTTKNLLILKMTISRTGYTGEDGIEIILPAKMATMALKLLIKENPDDDPNLRMQPIGLGARDTLRLEAGMPLYGHELDETIDPITAGLSFGVNLDKEEPFIGQQAIAAIKEAGPTRKRIGLKLDGKRTPRQGMAIFQGDNEVGVVTSGCLSPTLGYPIAMAYVASAALAKGGDLTVDLSGKRTPVEQVPLPFYKAK